MLDLATLLRGAWPNAATYTQRLENTVGFLAGACGASPAAEIARLATCRARLGLAGDAAALLGELATMVGPVLAAAGANEVPAVYEIVAVYRQTGLERFGYLTSGATRRSVAQATGQLLLGALQLLAAAGAQADTALLAALFKTAFPHPGVLDALAPGTAPLMIGVVPTGAGILLKAYFNTRHDSSTPHRERILAMLAQLGVADAGACDALGSEDATFGGVGVDLGHTGGRVKLYARVARAALPAYLPRLRAVGTSDPDEVTEFMQVLSGPALTSDMELAIALRPDGAPTLKATAFFDRAICGERDLDGVRRLLATSGYATDSFDRLLATAAGADTPKAAGGTLHGIGIEFGGSQPKLNVYVLPAA